MSAKNGNGGNLGFEKKLWGMADKMRGHMDVGAEEVEDDGIPFEEKMEKLTAELYEQFEKADQLETTIKRNLEVLGFGK